VKSDNSMEFHTFLSSMKSDTAENCANSGRTCLGNGLLLVTVIEGVTKAGSKHRCGCDYSKGGASPPPGFPLVESHLRVQTSSLPGRTGAVA
jgi:hypothetical protein